MQHHRLLVLFTLLAGSAHAQWLNFPTPGIPRTRDGKPNLTAPAPRALDGKPDLSGVWRHEITPPAELRRLFGAAIEVCQQSGGAGNGELPPITSVPAISSWTSRLKNAPLRPEARRKLCASSAASTNPCRRFAPSDNSASPSPASSPS